MNQYTRSLLFACAVALLASDFAVAQPSSEPQNPPELRRQLDELRVQIAEQTRQMNALQTRIEDMERTKAAAPAATVDQQATVPPAIATQYVMDATTNYQTFALDAEAAPRIDNAPLDPKFPGFFRLPGTSTFLKIGGYFKTALRVTHHQRMLVIEGGLTSDKFNPIAVQLIENHLHFVGLNLSAPIHQFPHRQIRIAGK